MDTIRTMDAGEMMTPEAVKAALDGATPGPWVIGSSEGRVLSHWDGIGYWEIANATVTDFCGYSGKAYFAGGTQKANADLIAMAPDLAREYLRLKEVEKAGGELAEAADWFKASTDAYLKHGGADNAERSILAQAALSTALTAFNAAVEGK